MVMGDSGLFGKTNLAKERTIKAQLKEEIEMAIQEIQTEEIPEGRNVDLNVLYNGKLEDKLENIIMELSKDEIIGEYKDYEYTIDDKLNVSIGEKVGTKPEITYELSSQEPQQEEVTITVKATIAEGEITSITNPDNVEENKNEISYKVTKNGRYKFIAKSSIGTETKITISVTNLKITAPVINVLQNGGYPLIKNDGIVSALSKVEIIYEDNPTLENYYSEDNGSTWKEYKGIIETDKNVIKAKSVVKENEQILSGITTQNIDAPNDAIGKEAYDGNEETFIAMHQKIAPGNNTRYMNIDQSLWGKRLRIKWWNWYYGGYYSTITFLDENGNSLSTYTLPAKSTYDEYYEVPQNAVKLKYFVKFANYNYSPEGFGKLFEIQPEYVKMPEIKISSEFPCLRLDGVKGQSFKLEIDSNATKTYYKINSQEWVEYKKDEEVDVNPGETIYARSSWGDNNMYYTRINSYSVSNQQIGKEAYDGNDETFVAMHPNIEPGNDTRYLNIDQSLWGKRLRIKWWNWNYRGYYSTITFLDENENSLSTYTLPANSTYDEYYEVPQNTVKLKYYVRFANAIYSSEGLGKLFEIQLVND